jgi:hypothetical protein
MSEPIGARVDFTVPFSLENVTKLIEWVRTAVLENWEKHADSKSEPAPNLDALQLPAAARVGRGSLFRLVGQVLFAWRYTFRLAPKSSVLSQHHRAC